MNVAIRQAALGCISGTLGEWPDLNAALQDYGIFLPDSTPAAEVREECRRWCEAWGVMKVRSEGKVA